MVVDLFQRIGTVTLNNVEAGHFKDAKVAWQGFGHSGVRQEFRVAVRAPGGAGDLTLPTSAWEPYSPLPNIEVIGIGNRTGSRGSLAPLTPAASENALPQGADVLEASAPRTRTPERCRNSTDDGDVRRTYKPISINNCDQIIPNLFLGGVTAALDTNLLLEQGFRAVCCCTRELEMPSDQWSKDLEYYRVDVEDMGHEPIELFFPEATEFIHSWVSREQPVLVHCRAGVSRSASVVIAYLLEYQGYTLHDAFFLVRSHRSIITPNVGFMDKLIQYEADKKEVDEPTIDEGKYHSWYTAEVRAAVPDLKPD